jgi:hypothetical protein
MSVRPWAASVAAELREVQASFTQSVEDMRSLLATAREDAAAAAAAGAGTEASATVAAIANLKSELRDQLSGGA